MLPTTKAVTALVISAAGALALDGAAAVVTPAPSCGGDSPCGPQISAVPGCATSCIESAASNLGCVGDDYSCHCSKYDAIQGSAINCVLGACGLGGALGVPGAVGALCSCVTANPTTPCEEPTSSTPVETTTPTTAIETLTSTSTGPKPTPTPACPGNECSFPSASEHECVASCIDAVLPEFGCNGVEDWNCYCTNFRKISSRSFACAYACGADIYAAFNNPASQGCSCLLKECPPSSSSSIAESSFSSIIEPEPTTTPPVPPTTTTPPPTSTCTHPCAPSITAIPTCATSCIVSAASAVGCGNNDFPCRCASSAVIQQSAVGCVLGACALDEALRVVDAVGALCQCVTASPVGTGCGDGEGTATESGTGTGGVTVTSTSEGEGTETSTVTEGEGTASSGSFVTETRTVEVTTSVCDDEEETGTVTVTAGPTCSLGCDGDDGGSDGGDGGGDDDTDGEDGDDEGGGSGPGPSPSSSPSGLPGGDNGGDSDDDGGASGGGPTTTPKPPVETAGASNNVLAWTGSLVAMIAAAVALI